MPRTDSEPVRGNCQRRMLTVDLDSQAVTNETPSNHTEVPHSRCAFHGPTFKRERDGGGGYGVYLAHSISHHYSARKSLTVGGVSLVRPLPVTGWTTCHRLAARRDCTFIIASMISGRPAGQPGNEPDLEEEGRESAPRDDAASPIIQLLVAEWWGMTRIWLAY